MSQQKVRTVPPVERDVEKIRNLYTLTWSDVQFLELQDHEVRWGVTVDQKREFLAYVSQSRDRNYYLSRWSAALFDSVGDYYSVGLYYAERHKSETRTSLPWLYTGQDQAEYYPKHPASQVHDMSYGEFQTFGWGKDSVGQAVREKLNGTPAEVINGILYTCTQEFKVPGLGEGFFEMMPDGLYQLYPYIENDYDYCGVPVKAHRWTSGPAHNYLEGMMILTEHGEVRVKRCNTYEREADYPLKGVFEYAETDMGEIPLRPRARQCSGQVVIVPPMEVVLEEVPLPNFKVVYSNKRGWHGNEFHICQDRVKKETKSGFVHLVGESGATVYTAAGVDYPLTSYVVTSKLIVFIEGKVAVFKDMEKKWDLVGGRLNEGESPIQAIYREYLEEVGEPLLQVPKYLSETRDGRYITHLFSITVAKLPSQGTWKIWEVGDAQVSWLSRLILAGLVAAVRRQVSVFSNGVVDCFGMAYDLTNYQTYSEALETVLSRESQIYLKTDKRKQIMRVDFEVLSHRSKTLGVFKEEVQKKLESGGPPPKMHSDVVPPPMEKVGGQQAKQKKRKKKKSKCKQ